MVPVDLISRIKAHKKRPNLDFRLKSKTEIFTDELFHTLFDANVSVEDHLKKLELDFDEITNLACFNPDATCKSI